MNEIWKDIPEFEGRYQVSNYGRVRSLHYCGHSIVKMLSPLKVKGYYQVILSKNGVKKHLLIHRLVWITFNGLIPEGMEVNHINEVKSDNRLSNLNLMTRKENVNWGTCIERRAKKISKHVFQFDLNGNFIKEWKSAKEVQVCFGYYSTAINNCCNGKRNTAYGFKWSYK